MADRPRGWRSVRRWIQRRAGSDCRISRHLCADGIRRGTSCRHLILRPGVERAHAASPGVCVRAGHESPPAADVQTNGGAELNAQTLNLRVVRSIPTGSPSYASTLVGAHRSAKSLDLTLTKAERTQLSALGRTPLAVIAPERHYIVVPPAAVVTQPAQDVLGCT